ncbi:MAG: ABC transporter substrate-binding protein [Acidobacteriia bacterium]|nr:ABC transporter substrate-binding protein [Terriglobia bacterium]
METKLSNKGAGRNPHAGKSPAGRVSRRLFLVVMLCLGLGSGVCSRFVAQPRTQSGTGISKDAAVLNVQGQRGGRLVVGITAAPRSFNWVIANDSASRQVTYQLLGDLIHLNRATQQIEPALAKSWQVSKDGLVYTMRLREGVHFSDGHSFDADDVVFTFQVYLDPKVNSTQRALLTINGQPLKVEKLGPLTVRFTFPQAHGPAERAFDVIGILPRHLLESAYREGRFEKMWTLAEDPKNVAGLGPFRLQKVVPGQRVILERNPHYWKVDGRKNPLPYLDELLFEVLPDQNAATLRLVSGDIDLLDKVLPTDYEFLKKSEADKGISLINAGPSLQYLFLGFNLNNSVNPATQKPYVDPEKEGWFSNVNFRRAIAYAIDRSSIIKLVYHGTAHEIFAQTSPSNKFWFNPKIVRYDLNLSRARELLSQAGFRVPSSDGVLRSPSGAPVEFTLVTNADNRERTRVSSLIQSDLQPLGIQVKLQAVEFNALVGKLTQSFDYDAVIMELGGGDDDPGAEMNVWLSSGPLHVWHVGEEKPSTAWEARIDTLMKEQMTTAQRAARKKAYDEVQKIVSEELPIIPLISRDVVVAMKKQIGNLQPVVIAPYALWNSEQLYLKH